MISTRWKKRIITSIIIWLSLVWSFSYAQETIPCNTCSTMSTELQQYITFANQIIDVLDSRSKLISNWSSYNILWPRQWWTYNGILIDKNPSGLIQGVILGTLKNLDRRQSQLRSTTEVLSIYTLDIFTDGALWFIVANQPWPIMRDFQYLLDIDTLISDKIYDLGAMWSQWKQLTSQERNMIIEILKNNIWEWKILQSTNDYILHPAMSSTDILRILLRINTRYKKALTLSTTKIDNSINARNSTIILSQVHFQNLVNNYKCVRIWTNTKSCWWSFENFKKSIDNITKSFIETGPKQSRSKINTAYKRLITRWKIIMWAEQKKEQNLEQYLLREHDLITSRWDGRTLTKRSGWWIFTWALSSNIPRQIQSSRDTVINESKNIITLRNGIKDNITPTETLSNLNRTQEKASETLISTQQIVISNSLSTVILHHQKTKNTQLNVSTFDSQEALSKITNRIRIINDLLGSNIKDDLTRTCNLQCSNLWWICW